MTLLTDRPVETGTPPPETRAGAALLAGVRDMAGPMLGVLPFGVVVGVTVAASRASHLAGWSTSWLVYGGSAQLSAIGGLDEGASPLVVVLGVALINLRLLLYASALAPHWRGRSRASRAASAYLVVDPSFAVGMEAYQRHPRREAHLRFLGGALVLYAGWQFATALGAVAGSGLPASWQLEFIGPLYMVALVVRQARTAALRIGALVAAAGAAVTVLALPHLASTTGMVAGLAIGSLLLRRSR